MASIEIGNRSSFDGSTLRALVDQLLEKSTFNRNKMQSKSVSFQLKGYGFSRDLLEPVLAQFSI